MWMSDGFGDEGGRLHSAPLCSDCTVQYCSASAATFELDGAVTAERPVDAEGVRAR